MPKDKFTISGYEIIEKTAKPHGNGARVLVPKDWTGEDVKIVRATDNKDSQSTIAPVAAIMNESLQNDGGLESAMLKVIKFKSFSDISNKIVLDFQSALDSYNTRQHLRQKAAKSENQQIEDFYAEICSTDSLAEVTERWAR